MLFLFEMHVVLNARQRKLLEMHGNACEFEMRDNARLEMHDNANEKDA